MRKIILLLIIAIYMFLPIAEVQASFGWGYKKNLEHQVPDIGMYGEILEKYGAYYADLSGEKSIYLTFDNGYEQGYTAKVLDVLKAEDVPATFFVTGHYVESEPELLQRMVKEGHIIGNHSYHHPDFTVITKEAIEEELLSLEQAVAEITDQKELKYLRPPRGTFNESTLQWSNELGYIHVFWSLAFADWHVDAQKGWKYAYDQIINQVHPGAIILLHTVSSDNAEALSRVIHKLKEDGYQFRSLDDLLLKDLLPEGIF